jgi:hypothetical protein
MVLTTRAAQRWFAAVWIAGFLALLFLLVWQTSTIPTFMEQRSAIFKWFAPAIVPTVGLLVGVLVGQAGNRRPVGKRVAKGVDTFVFWLAMVLSVAYLLMLVIIIWLAAARNEPTSIEESNLFLGFFQGITVAALGAFFVKRGSD